MRQATGEIEIRTRGKRLYEFTREIERWLDGQGMRTGLLTVFCRHTSASLVIQENADPDVQADLAAHFERAIPENGPYAHTIEGADDMPAHICSALTGVNLSIPLIGGRLALGEWQGIYLFEHRRSPHVRIVALHLMGE
ncbi:MAG TPA: secondary thiamine-phosphate synthase enzyme YjbQ [Bryobacteraceae bacterium]|nr:secondary thiamine-phosphate synthase enzyme YjbQ [Bryobacteraceae bacterium]HPT28286.1 secondary thiamine-phosphate synthase enzyme YjbQ [Bryobacteraceae bacterium]